MKGYLAAAGIGYLIGILFAPRQGASLRKDIRKHFEDLQIEAEIKSEELKEQFSTKVSKVSEHISKAGEAANGAFTKLDKNAHEILKSV